MRLFELAGQEAAQDLILVLRNQIQRANQSDSEVKLSWTAITNLMKSAGHGNYSYASFKPMFDANADLQNIIRNFNQDGVELNTTFDKPEDSADAVDTTSAPTKKVQQMAKRATNKRIQLTFVNILLYN